ncbi:MAG: secretin N-terminal domain-containing protein [Janthinobacterium lividum]
MTQTAITSIYCPALAQVLDTLGIGQPGFRADGGIYFEASFGDTPGGLFSVCLLPAGMGRLIIETRIAGVTAHQPSDNDLARLLREAGASAAETTSVVICFDAKSRGLLMHQWLDADIDADTLRAAIEASVARTAIARQALNATPAEAALPFSETSDAALRPGRRGRSAVKLSGRLLSMAIGLWMALLGLPAAHGAYAASLPVATAFSASGVGKAPLPAHFTASATSLSLAALQPTPAQATEPTPRSAGHRKRAANIALPWGSEPFTYFADGTRTVPVQRVIADFAAQYGLSPNVDRRVRGSLSESLSGDNPGDFLDRLAEAFTLDWFYYEGKLYVSRRVDRSTHAVRFAQASSRDAMAYLDALGLFNPRFRWTPLSDTGRAIVSGPPEYLRLVDAALTGLPDANAEPIDFGFFPLKHARVQDRIIDWRQERLIVPGVASIIADLLGGGGRAARGMRTQQIPLQGLAVMDHSSNDQTGMRRLDGTALFGRGLRDGSDGGTAMDSSYSANCADADRVPLPSQGVEQTEVWSTAFNARIAVVADARLNALIVRGPASVIAACRTLVERLDVAVPLVQLEALIVDVDESATQDLGIDWFVKSRHLELSALTGAGRMSGASHGDVDDAGSGLNGGGRLSTILPNGWDFLARIHALEGDGRAHVVSRPSILTQNNAVALLDMSETFYIRNHGERVTETVPINSGLKLQIVPGIVDLAEASPKVVMDLQIEDGRRTDEYVENIPVVRRSTISTQAMVRDGQSLLIAGHRVERSLADNRRVPGLASIPLLGKLFQGVRRATTRSKRFFLITPRIIDIDRMDPETLAGGPDLTRALGAGEAP